MALPAPTTRPWLAGVLLLLLAARLAWIGYQGAVADSNGFPSYYTASALVREGQPAARLYDDAWFSEQVRRFAPRIHEQMGPNVPTTALLLLPLAGLSLGAARAVWTALSLALLLLALGALGAELRLGGRLALLAGAALAFEPVRVNLLQGQAHLLVLAGWAAALVCYRRGRDLTLGAVLAAMFLLKSSGALLWPVLLLQRRFRALGAAVGCTLLGLALSLPWVGPEAWAEYLRAVPPQARAPWVSVTAHQSLPSLLLHLARPDARWNPGALLDAPALASGAISLLGAALVAGLLWLAWRGAPAELLVSVAVLESLVLIPVSADYHYCVALLPLAVALARLGPGRERGALLGCACAMGLALHHTSPRLQHGLAALLAYPMLYGALGLLALLLWSYREALRPPQPALATGGSVTR